MSSSGPEAAAMLAEPTDIATRLHAAGIDLPVPPAPAGAYRPVVIRGGLGFVSGQFPLVDGRLAMRGRLGAELSVGQGCEAAELAALNVLAQIQRVLRGWCRFAGLLRVDGYVASAGGFTQQPAVLDAASRLFVRALGPVAHLPLDAPIELVVTFAARWRAGIRGFVEEYPEWKPSVKIP